MLGGLAGCALILGATQSAGGVSGVTAYTFGGPLSDIRTTSTDAAFESAKALVKVTETAAGSSTWWIRIRGIEAVEGIEYHSHLHVGACVEGSGTTAGGHYNHTGGTPSPETEVWFELAPNDDGVAVYQTSVLFVPTDIHDENDQVMSIVIHDPIDGSRIACLPLDFSEDQQ